MKALFISTAAVMMAAPAIAGPYLNVESNSSFTDSDYTGSLLETHVGYESALGDASSWYIQGGPAFGFVDAEEEASQAVSGKVGVGVALTEKLGAYGEIAAITGDDWDFDVLSTGVKAGLKYTF